MLFPVCSFTQLSFKEHIIADNSHLPENAVHVQLADLDGDGDNDLLSASENDNKIAWFENQDGDGNFGAQRIISLEILQAQFVRVGDLDGDGDLDVIGVGNGSDDLMAFLNDGDGNFTALVIELQIRPRNIRLADIDLDGKLDIFVYTSSFDIFFFKNLSNDFSFESTKISETDFKQTYFFDAADVDNDGDIDIVTPSINIYKVSWHENIDAEFVTHEIDDLFGQYDLLRLADLDFDGDMDLIVSSHNNYEKPLWFRFNNLTGEYDEKHILYDEEIIMHSIDVLDTYLDSISNIAISSHAFEGIVSFDRINEVNGAMGVVSDTLCPLFILAGDVNGDQHMDIVTSDIAWMNFDATLNKFTEPNSFVRYTNNLQDLGLLDIDQDGDDDIITANDNDGRIGWFSNDNSDSLFVSTQNLISDWIKYISDIHIADIDGDDLDDVIVSSDFMDVLSWMRNEGGGSFSSPIIIDSNIQNPKSIRVTDMDEDGDLDVVVAVDYAALPDSGNQKFIVWYENVDGHGNFSEPFEVLRTFTSLSMVELADFNTDGRIDAVAALENGGLSWIANLFAGLFEMNARPIMYINQNVRVVDVADMDNDGDTDVVYSGNSSEAIYMSINKNGLGDFDEEIIIYEKRCNALKLADIDFDGDIDIIVSMQSEENPIFSDIYIIEQENEIWSQEPFKVNENQLLYVKNIKVVDLDNDGDLDVISVSQGDDKLAWYENKSMVSIQDVERFDFTISPTPVSTYLTIETDIQLEKINIYGINGKLMLTQNETSCINVSSMESGSYIIELFEINGKTSAKKFIKK